MSARDELTELQARGIAAASEVFDRLAAEIGGAGTAGGDDADAAGDPVGEQRLRAAGARLVDLFAGLFQDGIEAYLELAQSIVQGPRAGASGGAEILSARGAAGARATTTVWIHNAPQAPAGEVVLALTDLQSADGARIDASRAVFVPRRLHIDAGASAPSLLTLAIPSATAAGTYFGHVLAAGLPAGGLPLRLVVEKAEG